MNWNIIAPMYVLMSYNMCILKLILNHDKYILYLPLTTSSLILFSNSKIWVKENKEWIKFKASGSICPQRHFVIFPATSQQNEQWVNKMTRIGAVLAINHPSIFEKLKIILAHPNDGFQPR